MNITLQTFTIMPTAKVFQNKKTSNFAIKKNGNNYQIQPIGTDKICFSGQIEKIDNCISRGDVSIGELKKSILATKKDKFTVLPDKMRDLRGFDFTKLGIDLKNTNLSYTDCSGAIFEDLDLSHTFIVGSKFNNKTNFTNCRLNRAKIINSNFNNSIIEKTNFSNAEIDENTTFKNAICSNKTIWTDEKLIKPETIFSFEMKFNTPVKKGNCVSRGEVSIKQLKEALIKTKKNLNKDILPEKMRDLKGFDFRTLGKDFDLSKMDLSYTDCSNANFAGLKLEGLSAKYANFTNANLQKTNLKNAHIEHSNLSEAKLQQARLEHVYIIDTKCLNTQMQGANLNRIFTKSLKGAIFDDKTNWIDFDSNDYHDDVIGTIDAKTAQKYGIKFVSNCISRGEVSIEQLRDAIATTRKDKTKKLPDNMLDLKGLDFTKHKIKLSGANLSGTDCSYAIFEGMNLDNLTAENAIFDYTYLSDAKLNFAKLKDSKFRFAILGCSYERNNPKIELASSPAKLMGTNIINTDFSNSSMAKVSLEGSDIEGASFNNAILFQAIFNNTIIDNADFTDSMLEFANFGNSQCLKSKFINADLKWAKFINNTILDEIDFSKSELSGINFSTSEINNCIFNDTTYSHTIQWTNGNTIEDSLAKKLGMHYKQKDSIFNY